MKQASNNKLDLAKEDKNYYQAKAEPHLISLPPLPYLAVQDQGVPDGPVFAAATEALYTIAYTIKRMCKHENRDFVVPKLEGLWWVLSDQDALAVPQEEWQWKLLIRMPDFVTADLVEIAKQEALANKPARAPLAHTSYEMLHEGTCVQMLHVGPYHTEPDTIARIKMFMAEKQLQQNGLHHEIYLSDPRKSEPSSLKTILRFPVIPMSDS